MTILINSSTKQYTVINFVSSISPISCLVSVVTYLIPEDGRFFYPFPRKLEIRPISVRYLAGYVPDKTPGDLASTCLELVAWNMARCRDTG
jgi:hypothetical protein